MYNESEYYYAYICDTLSRQFFHDINQPISILDFGCGNGLLTFYMHRAFFNAHIVGVDPNELLIQENRKNYPHLTFISLHNNSLQFTNATFDIIYSVNVFHHIEKINHKKIVQDLIKTVKPSGSLIIFEFNPYNLHARKIFKQEHTTDFQMIRPNYWKNLLKNEGLDIQITYLYPNFSKIEHYLGKIPLGNLYVMYIKLKAE